MNTDLSDRFFKDGEKAKIDPNHSIHKSYRHLIEFFAQREELNENDAVIGSFSVYGLMPTILDLRGDLAKTVLLLNKVKREGSRLSVEEIKEIASRVNGSITGTSKLLHFVRPDVHAMWDSRVYRYLYRIEPHQYRLNADGAYHNYLETLAKLGKDQRFPKLKERIEKQLRYNVSNNRIGEFVMYFHGAPALIG